MDKSLLPLAAQQFLEQLLTQRRLSPLTQRRYAHALGVLHQQAPRLDAIHTAPLQRIVSQQFAQGLSPRSLAVMVSAWRSYCQWAMHQGLMTSNPATDLLLPKMSKPLPKAIAVDSVESFLNAAAPSERSNSDPQNSGSDAMDCAVDRAMAARDQAMIELLYGCGIRSSELIGLDCEKHPTSTGWIDWAMPAIRVLGKGRKPRIIPLPSAARSAVQAWLSARSACFQTQTSAVFLGKRGARISGTELRRATQRRAQLAQLGQGVHPHMLRHSYASHLLQSSADLRGVQELLGHASIQATQVYTRLDFQHLSQVYDKTHPRAKTV
jgi:integrase/recombinase XerC